MLVKKYTLERNPKMKQYPILIIVFTLIFCSRATAQWVQTNGPICGVVNVVMQHGGNFFAGTEGGVFRSTDSGISWTAASTGLTRRTINSLTDKDTRLFAGTDQGVFTSTDFGTSWTATASSISGTSITALAVCGDAIVAGGPDRALFRSVDNGTTWEKITVSATDFADVQTFAVCNGKIFAGSNAQDYIRSDDSGKTWKVVKMDLMSSSVIASVVRDSIIIGGFIFSGICRSDDGGTTWTEYDGPVGSSVYSFAWCGDYLFAGTYRDGVFRSADTGKTWVAVNEGLTDLYISSLSTADGILLAGSMHDGVFLSNDKGENWTAIDSGLVSGTVNVLQSADGKLYAATDAGLHLSIDNGETWLPLYPDLFKRYIFHGLAAGNGKVYAATWRESIFTLFTDDSTLDTSFGVVPRVEAIAATDTIVLLGSGVVGTQRSFDNGITWMTTDALNSYSSFSFAEDGNAVFAGTARYGVIRSTDNGATWITVNTGLPDSASVPALGICNGTVFAGTVNNGIYRSTDRGDHWSAAGDGIDMNYIRSIAVYDNAVFAGTWTEGVYLSTDNGDHWTEVNEGLGERRVKTLTTGCGYIFAGTDGSSVWRRPVSDMVAIGKGRLQSEETGRYGYLTMANNGKTGSVTLSFYLPRQNQAALGIYDLSGREIKSLVNKFLPPGSYRYIWNTRAAAKGCYLVRLQRGKNCSCSMIHLF